MLCYNVTLGSIRNIHCLLGFNPGADAQDLVKVEGHLTLLNQSLHLPSLSVREDSHQSLGGEPVLGSLLVVPLGHVREHLVGGLIDVMDDLAEVSLEVALGEVLQVGQGGWRDVSLPLEVSLPSVHHGSQAAVLAHKLNKRFAHRQLLGGDGAFPAGWQSKSGLLVRLNGFSGSNGGLPHVTSEHNQIEVFVNVVHNLGLQEGLGGVVHDLVAQLGLGDVLPELLDSSASSLLGSVQINDLISTVLGSSSVIHLGHQVLHHLKLSSEQGVLAHVHLVLVILQNGSIDSGNSLNQAFVAGGDLELFEETGDDAGSGGSGETDLVGDDDGGVDGGTEEGLADDVEICLFRSSRVADRDPPVDETGVLLLQTFDSLAETLQLLHLNLGLLLVDVHHLQLPAVGALPSLHHLEELHLVRLDDVPGDVAQLGVLSDLVGRSGTHGLPVDVDVRLLPHVEPDDGAVLGVDRPADLLQGSLEPGQCWLVAAVDLEAGNPPEVGTAGNGIGELLYFVKMVEHTDRGLHVPHDGGVSCPGGQVRLPC